MLVDSGYMQNLKPTTVLWSLCPSTGSDANNSNNSNSYNSNSSHQSMKECPTSFLNQLEYQKTEDFKKHKIYAQVVTDWSRNINNKIENEVTQTTSNSNSNDMNRRIAKTSDTTSTSNTTDILTEWFVFNEERYSMFHTSNTNNNNNSDTSEYENNNTTNNTITANTNTFYPPQTPEFWTNLLGTEYYKKEAIIQPEIIKHEKEVLRRKRYINMLNQFLLQPTLENTTTTSSNTNNISSSNSKDLSKSNTTNTTPFQNSNSNTIHNNAPTTNTKLKVKPVNKPKTLEFDYQDILPTGTATALTVATRCIPGDQMYRALRGLAYLVVRQQQQIIGEEVQNEEVDPFKIYSPPSLSASLSLSNPPRIDLNWDSTELSQYVMNQGGLSWLLSLPVHFAIK